MNEVIKNILNNLAQMFEATDEALSSWVESRNLQLPALMGMVSTKMNWNEKQLREADPIIRYYIRNNPNYHVTRGAHGGIMRLSDKLKKEDDRNARMAVKKEVQALLEAKLSALTIKSSADSVSTDNSVYLSSGLSPEDLVENNLDDSEPSDEESDEEFSQ